MALVINSNMASLATQRNLATAQADSATTLQRLSSGLRINSAKDDAAGLSIAESFTKQVNGFNQAARNANDAVSLVQTAEGALQQVTDNLQRIRELSVQAASDTYTDTERALLQKEVTALVDEIDRIAEATTFNGTKLIDGNFTSKTFQVGANNATTDRIDSGTFVDVNKAALGVSAQHSVTSSFALQTSALGIASGELTVKVGTGSAFTVPAVTDPGFADGGSYSKLVLDSIKQANTSVDGSVAATSADLGIFTAVAGTNAADTYALTINGQAIISSTNLSTDGITQGELDTALANNATNLANLGIVVSGTAATGITLTASDGRNINVQQVVAETGTVSGTFANAQNNATGTTNHIQYANITLTAGEQITIGGTQETDAGFTNSQTSSATGTAIGSGSIATLSGAQTMITSIDSALTTVNGGRADLGALQARFESVANTLSVAAETAAAARSRVQDADFAAESANLARNQVLQQAGISMLAQANAMPQQVLALLQ